MSAGFLAGAPGRRALLPALIAWVGVYALLFGFVAAKNPAYFESPALQPNPDAVHYLELGDNFWARGVYSRQAEPPYQPDVLRTPVYPLFAGALVTGFGAVWPLLVVQALLHFGTVVVVHRFGRHLFGDGPAALAAVLLAVDLTLAVLSLEAMSEPLFVFLATLGALLWIRALGDGRPSAGDAVSTGLLVGLAILTRPAALYLPLVLAGCGLAAAPGAVRRRAAAANAVLLLVVAYGLLVPWIVRNHVQFGVTRITTADSINLLYFAAAGALQIEHGITREEAEARIVAEHSVATLREANNFWKAKKSVVEMDAEQREVAWRIITHHPVPFAAATVAGLGKAMIAHSAPEVASMAAVEWKAPRSSALAQGRVGEALGRLAENPAALVAVFLWQVPFALVTLLFGLWGAWRVMGLVRLPAAARGAILLVCAYHAATIALVGLDAYARHRAPLLPFLCLFSAVAWVRTTGMEVGNAGRVMRKRSGAPADGT